MKWLIDTNVISESRRPNPNTAVIEWVNSLPLAEAHTTSVNMAELAYGAEVVSDVVKRRALLKWIDFEVRVWLAGRIHDVNEHDLIRWKHLMRESDVNKRPAPATDLLVAAIALTNEFNVATRDVAPFVACGVPTLNPWTGERFNGA